MPVDRLPPPRVWPVVHHDHAALTLAQADLAFAAGAHGVFLIAHAAPDEDLVPLIHAVKARHPGRAVGVNFLRSTALEAAQRCVREGLDTLWVDAAGVSSRGITTAGQALAHFSREAGLTVFAGVAFKYQEVEPNPAAAALQAMSRGWIPTTSGVATGQAADLDQVRRMRQALDEVPRDPSRLALASGLTPENVHAYRSTVTDFLVATGVSHDMHRFDPARLAQFIERATGAAPDR